MPAIPPDIQAIQEQLHESQVLLEISQRLAGTTELSTILQQIVDAAVMLIKRAERSVIHVLDEKNALLDAVTVAGRDRRSIVRPLTFNPGQGLAGLALQEGLTIRVGNVYEDRRFVPGPDTDQRIYSLMVAPVITADRKLGVLSVHSSSVDAFTERDERLLTMLGVSAALTLDKAQMLQTTRARLDEVNALYRIVQGLLECFDVENALKQVVQPLHEYFGYSHVHAFLRDKNSGDAILGYGSGEIGAQLLAQRYRIPAGQGIVGHVFETGQPFVTNDANVVPFRFHNPLLPNTTAELAVPIRSGNRVLGVLDLQYRPPKTFQDDDLRLMVTVANQLGMVIEKLAINADLQAALHHEQSARAQLVQSEKLAALGRIVATVVHELNNPLQAIQNALYLVKTSEGLDEQARDDLHIALDETTRMAEIIARLRDTYRPASREEFHLESLNVIIQDVRKLINAHLERNHIEFNFQADTALPMVPLIRDQIKQVILNMCLNAVEAMRSGGTLIVRTRFEAKKSRVCFSVTDSGDGIPESILPHIFDPFVTTKEMGTGLGLAISYDIVQRHHGQFDVESKVGKGSTFTVWLPMER
ncbi:MAG: GAF domain-containing protein [Chloroflexota bacterium]